MLLDQLKLRAYVRTCRQLQTGAANTSDQHAIIFFVVLVVRSKIRCRCSPVVVRQSHLAICDRHSKAPLPDGDYVAATHINCPLAGKGNLFEHDAGEPANRAGQHLCSMLSGRARTGLDLPGVTEELHRFELRTTCARGLGDHGPATRGLRVGWRGFDKTRGKTMRCGRVGSTTTANTSVGAQRTRTMGPRCSTWDVPPELE